MLAMVLFDLDGTVYRGSQAVTGAADCITTLAQWGVPYRFVTNRSNRLPETILSHLHRLDIPCQLEHIMTTASATARYLKPSRTYVIGEEGLRRALLDQGFEIASEDVRYVIVGFDANFSYEKLERACLLIRSGATLIGTNPDPFFNTDKGLSPETGSLVAAIESATDTKATYVGKPHPLLLEMCLQEVGASAKDSVMIGDNLLTDIPAGRAAGTQTALILTGVCSEEDAENAACKPDYIVEHYEAFMEILEDLRS